MQIHGNDSDNEEFLIPRMYYIYLLGIEIYFYAIFYYLIKDLPYKYEIKPETLLIGLFQSETATFALIITLSFISVQLVSSVYSARVVDVFISFFDFKLIFFLYLFNISYILSVELVYSYRGFSNSFIFLDIPILLSIFAYLALIPFLLNLLNLFKPSNIIRQLSFDINLDNILNMNGLGSEQDPFQPIIDILINSLNRSDMATTNTGLKIINLRFNHILLENGLKNTCIECERINEIKKMISCFFTHLKDLCFIGLRIDDELNSRKILELIIENSSKKCQFGVFLSESSAIALSEIGQFAAKKRQSDVGQIATVAAEALGKIGEEAESCKIVSIAIKALEKIGEEAADNEHGDSKQAASIAVEVLGRIGIKAVDKNQCESGQIASIAAGALGKIGIKAADIGQGNPGQAASIAAEELGKIGIKAADKSQGDAGQAASIAAEELGKIGETAIDKGQGNAGQAASIAVKELGKIGIAAAEKGQCEIGQAASKAIEAFRKIGFKIFLRKSGNSNELPSHIISGLAEIGLAIVRHPTSSNSLVSNSISILKELGLDYLDTESADSIQNIREISDNIKDIGKAACESRSKTKQELVFESANSLLDIGLDVVKNESQKFNVINYQIIKNLSDLGLCSIKERIPNVSNDELNIIDMIIYLTECYIDANNTRMACLSIENLGKIRELSHNESVYNIERKILNSLKLFSEIAERKGLIEIKSHCLKYITKI